MNPIAAPHQVADFRRGIETRLEQTFAKTFDMYFADRPRADQISAAGNLGAAAAIDLRSMGEAFAKRTAAMARPGQATVPAQNASAEIAGRAGSRDSGAAKSAPGVGSEAAATAGAGVGHSADPAGNPWTSQSRGTWSNPASAENTGARRPVKPGTTPAPRIGRPGRGAGRGDSPQR